MELRLAASDDQRLAVYRLRYDVYIDELRYHLPLADHAQRAMHDDLESGSELIMALEDGRVVGSLRVHLGGDGGLPDAFIDNFDIARFVSHLPIDRIMVASRFVVRTSHRRRSLSFRLIEFAFRMAAERGMELAFIECLPHLIPLYQKLGFRRVGPGFYRDDSGVLSPMCLVVRDLAYLKERRSPLYATARQLFGEALPPSWLEALFPDGEPGDDTAAAIERWSEAHGVLSTGELHAQTVLGGFSADELQRVIERGVVIDCSAGERLILSGSGHRNLYIVLEGSCEVRLDGRSLGVVAAGDVVGEMAWLLDSQRTADVVATGCACCR